MNLYSTRATIQNQEVTVLAVVETAAATIISGWYYFHFGTLVHFVIAAALAPVVLIRTPASTNLSISLAFPLSQYVGRFVIAMGVREGGTSILRAIVDMFIFFVTNLFAIALFFVAKLVAGIWGLVARPIQTVSAIPENWRKVVLCTDTATLPEIIPGISELANDDPRRGLKRWSVEFWLPRDSELRDTIWVWVIAGLIALPIVIPALAYRWSIKMTALIWSPLVWAFRPLTRNENVLVFARKVVDLSIYKVGRIYSGIVLVASIFKVIIFLFWLRLEESWRAILDDPVVGSYLQPREIPLWQVAAFGSACITLIIFIRSEKFLLLSDSRIAESRDAFKRFAKWSIVLRNVFSIYTAACTLYITFKLAKSIDIPPLNFILFPW